MDALADELAAGTGIGGENELEPGGKPRRALGSGDDDLAVLERLAESFEHFGSELGGFVQEEHAVVGEGDRTGSRNAEASADDRGRASRVVGVAERWPGDERGLWWEGAGDGVDGRDLQRACGIEVGEQGGETFGEHGLSGAWRTGEEHMVAAGRGDLEGLAGYGLAHDLGEVETGEPSGTGDDAVGVLADLGLFVRGLVRELVLAEYGEELAEGADAEDFGVFDESGLGDVRLGDDEPAVTGVRRGENGREDAAGVPCAAVESELAEEDDAVDRLLLEVVGRGEDGDGDRDVEVRAGLGQRGGRKADGDLLGRPFDVGVGDCRSDAVAGLVQGLVGQADDAERGQPAAEVRLDLDEVALDAYQRDTTSAGGRHRTAFRTSVVGGGAGAGRGIAVLAGGWARLGASRVG